MSQKTVTVAGMGVFWHCTAHNSSSPPFT